MTSTPNTEQEIKRIRLELAEARKALEKVSNLIDDYYFEGDKEYQVVIIARAALRAGEEGK